MYLFLLFTAFVAALVIGTWLFLNDEHHEEAALSFIGGAVLVFLILKEAVPYLDTSPFWFMWPVLGSVAILACAVFVFVLIQRSLACGRLHRQ